MIVNAVTENVVTINDFTSTISVTESEPILINTSSGTVVTTSSVPVVQTLGAYNVSAQYTVPVQAQAILIGGATNAPTAIENAEAVW